jgi:uncharacterized protein (DUF433 family)
LIVSAESDGTDCQAEAAIARQQQPLSDHLRFALGIYSASEVARYVGVPRSTLLGWINPPRDGVPLVTALARCGEELPVPFIGFVEAFVLQAARSAGLPAPAVRRGAEAVTDKLAAPHPLASSALVHPDVIELFVRETTLVRRKVAVRRHELAAALTEHLRAIEYAEDGYAERVRLRRYAPAHVVVDPLVAFGLPFVVGPGPRVQDVLDRFLAGDSRDSIAYDFGLTGSAVDAIIVAATP